MSEDARFDIVTDRLRLRKWVDDDLESFFEMSNCAKVMEHFPGLLSREECQAAIQRIQKHFEEHGFGYWVVEYEQHRFTGFVGIAVPRFEADFTPCVEIGWRLKNEFWGLGIATEAAKAVCQHAFEELKLTELVAMTAPANHRSQHVMQKLGMTRDPQEDFDHPLLEDGHPLERHVLYRLTADQWKSLQA